MNRWIFSTLKFILEEKEVTLLCCGCLTVFCARNPGMNKFCRLQSRMWFFVVVVCHFLFYFDCVEMVWRLLSSNDFLRFLCARREWLGKQSLEFLLLELYYISKAESEEMLPDINTVETEFPGSDQVRVTWTQGQAVFSNRSSMWMHWSKSRGVQKRAQSWKMWVWNVAVQSTSKALHVLF